MSADVIPFEPKQRSNGAREALIEIMRPSMTRPIADWDSPNVTDYILASLYEAGFVIVPRNVDLGA